MKWRRRKFVFALLLFLPQLWLFMRLNLTENVEADVRNTESRRNLKELILRHHGKPYGAEEPGRGSGQYRNASAVIKDLFRIQQDPLRRLKDAPFSPSFNQHGSQPENYAKNPLIFSAVNQPERRSHNHDHQIIATSVNNPQISDNNNTRTRFPKHIEEDFRERLRQLKSELFTAELGAGSDSVCAIPEMSSPEGVCPDIPVRWQCDMAPTFSTLNTHTRTILVNCSGRWRVNQVDRTEHEQMVSRDNYRNPPKWQYYQGHREIRMETEYADVVCKGRRNRNMHNYHTQFLPKPNADKRQQTILHLTKTKEPNWKPLSVLTVVLDSFSRAHAHRGCGIPKTIRLLEQLYDGSFTDSGGTTLSSHQAFLFNRFNSISSATALNLTPMFSGELYDDVDLEHIRQGIYAKDVKEWIWQYANHRGYLTSYGIDNNSGMMGTRTNCKACHYRPPVLPHTEHGWAGRENEQVITNVLSGLCDGNHMLHEHILNYTREFLRHPHPAKWAALDLNAGHRKEMESVNQVDHHLFEFLKTVLEENPNLVVFILGDHGKPYQKQPGHLGGYYETLLPFLSVVMPTWVLQQAPSIMDNLIVNQQRYLVPADLHMSMKSLLHFPHLDAIKGAKAPKSINVFSQIIPRNRTCQDAFIPEWSCACGIMRKLASKEWSILHYDMVQQTLDDINAQHSQARLATIQMEGITANTPTSCLDLHLLKILHIFVNENPGEDALSPRRYIFHITFQTVELNTVWRVIIDSGLDIKQIKQISIYQKYDICWDKRVPLPFCVCGTSEETVYQNTHWNRRVR